MADKTVNGWQRSVVVGADRTVWRLTAHWLLVVNLLVFTYVGLPFLAPVFMEYGMTGPANVIYDAYSLVCHQFAFRSWYLFGDQIAYPRAKAHSSLASFESYAVQDPFFDDVDVTTLDTDLVLAARAFRGNPQMGYKVAFCQRDVAIYGGMVVAGLGFALLRKRLKPLLFWQYLVIGILPITLDGFSQLFNNPPFDQPGYGLFSLIGQLSGVLFGVRESTPFLRVLTGFLFGLANVWLAYPYIEEAMQETRQKVEATLGRAGLSF